MKRLKLPALHTRTTYLAISATMVFVGAAVSSYGPVVAYDFPGRMVEHPLFPAALLLAGVSGIALYLLKALFPKALDTLTYRIVSTAGVLLFVSSALTTGSPSFIAWSVATAVFVLFVPSAEERSSDTEARTALLPYALTILIVHGLAEMLVGGNPLGRTAVIPYVSILLGAAGLLTFARGQDGPIQVLRLGAGFWMIFVSLYFAVQGRPLIDLLFFLPAACALLFLPYLEKMRFGRSPVSADDDEAKRVRQFQDVTELNAWAVYVFALLHIYISPNTEGNVFFFLFILAFVSFVYQYRYRSILEVTYRDFFLNSFRNLIILSVASHFSGGLASPFNWFFLLIILSGVVGKSRARINEKLAFIIGYYVFETVLAFLEGATGAKIVDLLLIQTFAILVSGLYIHRITALQVAIDEETSGSNRELKKVLARELEAKEVISSQALELRQTEAQLETVLSSVGDAVVAVDSNGGIVFLNEAASAIGDSGGKTPTGDKIGRPVTEVFPLESHQDDVPTFERALGLLMRGEDVPGVEQYLTGDENPRRLILFPDDTHIETEEGWRYFEGILVFLEEEIKGVKAVLTFRDITYRKEVDRLKEDFMSVAAHQLRTPLSSIRWFLELLNDPEEGKLSKNQKMFARNAYASLMRMIGLVNGLLAVTRVEAARVPSNPEPLSIEGMTRQLMEEFGDEIRKKELKVRLKVHGPIPDIPLDPQLSREVFMNLLSNAVRYSEPRGEILIVVSDDGKAAEWSIHDDGIGIPKAQQGKIFTKFFRASNAARIESNGTGLGLYLAKFIANGWGGDISFESEEGEGSTFRVTVPRGGMRKRGGEVSLHA